jgi:glycosyltransferase involved in cell wall biosynthesis
MDRVVCVSANQAARVGRTGVSRSRVVVIHNAIDPERFGQLEASYREKLLALFPKPPGQIVGAAGRLSPEKGFQILVQAAARLVTRNRSVGLVLFGEGPLRDQLSRDIIAASLRDRVILAGFRADLDRFLPWLDVLVLPSFTEGLPNVVLEGCAVGVPIVATAVGGTPEIIQDGVTGFLVPPGNVTALAERLHAVLGALQGARMVGERGRRRVLEKFTFPVQAEQYRRLLANLGACSNTRALPANILRRGGSRAVNITTTSPTGR